MKTFIRKKMELVKNLIATIRAKKKHISVCLYSQGTQQQITKCKKVVHSTPVSPAYILEILEHL